MGKFNYKKWVSEKKHGKPLLEQSQLGDTPPYDGTVNQDDIDWVTNNWLQPGDAYDSNDNIVNLDDLTLVTGNFGQGTSTTGSGEEDSGGEEGGEEGGDAGNACTTPTSLSTSNITINTALLQWTGGGSSTTNYSIIYREQGVQNWTTANSSSPTHPLSGLLSSATTYEWGVYSICGTTTSQMSTGNAPYTNSYNGVNFTPELFDTATPERWWCTGTGTVAGTGTGTGRH